VRTTLRHLELFVAVCDAGGVGEAGRRVHAAQSTVSAAVRDLERQLGVDLLVRRPGGVAVPTPAGRRLLAEARALLDQADTLDRVALDLRDEVAGDVAFGSLVTIAPLAVPRLAAAFRERHPQARLRAVEAGQAELLAGLADGRLELVLTYDLGLPAEVDFEELASLPPRALLAHGDPLAGESRIALRDLARRDFVLLDLPLSREYFAGLFAAQGLEPLVAHRSPHLEVVRAYVAAGLGCSIVNAVPASDRALDGSRLVTRPLAGRHRALRLGLVTREGARPTRAVAALREAIADEIGAGRLLSAS
jgi:DNA-binding transcriptional LysR family regulator